MLSGFHFLRPLWLLALIPLGAAVYWLIRQKPGLRRWERIVDANLAPHVLIGGAATARRLPALLVALAGTLAIGALAGPVWQKLPQPVFASEDALIILLDLSQSMRVEDIKPSRLERARFKIADILKRRDEGQTALLVFAAEAYAVSPLTDDTETIAVQLSALTPELMPSQGSRADRAMAKALELLHQGGGRRGDVLLVTDGVDAGRDGDLAAELRGAGLRVSVLGVGTPEGGPVPGSSGFLKRLDGSIVIAALDAAALQQVATRGGGIYQEITADDRDIERLASVLESRQPSEISERELAADVWREEGPWLLLPLLPIVALGFRRGILASVAILLFVPPVPLQAMSMDDLWSRPDQRAERALDAGDAESAAALFRDPAWRAAAQYRAGQYDRAVDTLAELEGAQASYNRGNALARQGRYEEAIAAYEQALQSEPEHADAQFNRDLLLEQMQQQQQQQQDSGQSGDGESQPQDEAGGQSGDSGDESQSGQQSADQNQGDGADGSQSAMNDEAQGDDSAQAAGQDGSQSDADQEQQDDLRSAIDDETQAESGETGEPGQTDAGQDESDGEEQQATTGIASSDEPLDESEQAVEQWLRRIPDDPGGLLRRKFYYQYRRQPQPEAEPEQW